MNPIELETLKDWFIKKLRSPYGFIITVGYIIVGLLIIIIIAYCNGYFTQIGKEHAENIPKPESKLQNNQIIDGIKNPETADSNDIKQKFPEDNLNIPPVWRDTTLGIEFVKVVGKNYWIGKDEITANQFGKYFSNTGFTNVAQDQSPGCISIARPERGKTQSDDVVTCISLKETLKFADWLTEKNNSGTFSLSTRSEWQVACNTGLINSSTLEWCSDKLYPDMPDDPTYLVVGTPSRQSPLDCNYTDSGYALQRREDVGFRLVWRP